MRILMPFFLPALNVLTLSSGIKPISSTKEEIIPTPKCHSFNRKGNSSRSSWPIPFRMGNNRKPFVPGRLADFMPRTWSKSWEMPWPRNVLRRGYKLSSAKQESNAFWKSSTTKACRSQDNTIMCIWIVPIFGAPNAKAMYWLARTAEEQTIGPMITGTIFCRVLGCY